MQLGTQPTFEYEHALHQIDYDTALADSAFCDAITLTLELGDESSDNIFTEARKATLGDALKVLLSKIIAAFQKLKDAITTEVHQRIFSEEYKKHIEQLKKDVLTAEIHHAKTVKMVDFKTASALYEQMVGELLEKSKRIADVKYLTVKGLDNDIDEFYKIANSYDAKLTKVFEEEKEFPIAEVIRFIDKESNGGPILGSLDRAMRQFKEMESDVRAIETKESIVGKDLITKKVSIIRQSSNKVFKMIKKWIAKLIGKCVFYFA